MQQRRRRTTQRRRSRATAPVVVLASMILLVGSLAVIGVWALSGSGSNSAAGTSSSAAQIPPLDGAARVAGVEVVQAAFDAGRVPLNTAVERVFRLRNTGNTPVTLGKASIEVLEGC